MLRVSEIFIYPIKSLGGIAVSSSPVTDRGFQYDRRWMLVKKNHQFMTQREFPAMSLLQTSFAADELRIVHKQNRASLTIPLQEQSDEEIVVQVWNDICKAQLVSSEADEWFSEMLSVSCRLVYMPDAIQRRVEKPYAKNDEITSFSDAYPFLIIGQSSLDDLNSRLEEPLPVNRFRPNFVFTGAAAYEEDLMEHFTINQIDFFGVKPCARCAVTTVNQDNAVRDKEPLKTLASYRMKDNNVYFGQNLLHRGRGLIKTGDELVVKKKNPALQFFQQAHI